MDVWQKYVACYRSFSPHDETHPRRRSCRHVVEQTRPSVDRGAENNTGMEGAGSSCPTVLDAEAQVDSVKKLGESASSPQHMDVEEVATSSPQGQGLVVSGDAYSLGATSRTSAIQRRPCGREFARGQSAPPAIEGRGAPVGQKGVGGRSRVGHEKWPQAKGLIKRCRHEI